MSEERTSSQLHTLFAMTSATRYGGTMRVLRGMEWIPETVERGDRFIGIGNNDIDKLPAADDGEWIELPYSSGSDYSGGAVNVANYRTFLDEFGPILITASTGWYGDYTILAHIDDCAEGGELWDVLDDLAGYPVIDDEMLSTVEREAEAEAWESWLSQDVRATIDPDDHLDWLSDDLLWNAFEDAASEQDEYWIHETGNQASIDFGRVIRNAAS